MFFNLFLHKLRSRVRDGVNLILHISEISTVISIALLFFCAVAGIIAFLNYQSALQNVQVVLLGLTIVAELIALCLQNSY